MTKQHILQASSDSPSTPAPQQPVDAQKVRAALEDMLKRTAPKAATSPSGTTSPAQGGGAAH